MSEYKAFTNVRKAYAEIYYPKAEGLVFPISHDMIDDLLFHVEQKDPEGYTSDELFMDIMTVRYVLMEDEYA